MIKKFDIDTLLNDHFESRIIYRGEEYYYEDLIKSVIWNKNESLEVTVVGTKIYDVTIHIKKGKIIDFSCNCPYEHHCKHEVAALIYLWENIEEINKNCQYDNKQLKMIEEAIKCMSKENLESLTLQFLNKDYIFREYCLEKLKIGKVK